VLLAPALAIEFAEEQMLEPIAVESDGILPIPSINLKMRARDYWREYRRLWLTEARHWIAKSQIVHAGLDDVYRPIMYDAFREAVRQKKPTVFVQDTDIAGQVCDVAKTAPWDHSWGLLAYAVAYRRMAIHGVRKATLSLLKGSDLMRIYGPYAKNPKEIQDTSYYRDEIVPSQLVKRRFDSLECGRPLRLVYCGRLIDRKGVGSSIDIVCEACRHGANVMFDIIGGGAQEADLKAKVAALGIADRVRFLGKMNYGPELLNRMSTYDGLLFTPLIEDTPRMIFDGYAAGLPLLGWDINFVRERSRRERAVCELPLGDISGSVLRLLDLLNDRPRLRRLTDAALVAAVDHSAENWYRRRAEWTIEAYARAQATLARKGI
jgi:glycosyltransferase involved in cell wall biosynthesis